MMPAFWTLRNSRTRQRVTAIIAGMATPQELLEHAQTIAIVGLSPKPDRPSYHVAADLQAAGFRIIPVNPAVTTVLGETAYPSLHDVPVSIDIVDVFRRAEDTPQIARDAVAVGARALWLQLGIRSAETREIAENGGLDYVEDLCTKVERHRYGITK